MVVQTSGLKESRDVPLAISWFINDGGIDQQRLVSVVVDWSRDPETSEALAKMAETQEKLTRTVYPFDVAFLRQHGIPPAEAGGLVQRYLEFAKTAEYDLVTHSWGWGLPFLSRLLPLEWWQSLTPHVVDVGALWKAGQAGMCLMPDESREAYYTRLASVRAPQKSSYEGLLRSGLDLPPGEWHKAPSAGFVKPVVLWWIYRRFFDIQMGVANDAGTSGTWEDLSVQVSPEIRGAITDEGIPGTLLRA